MGMGGWFILGFVVGAQTMVLLIVAGGILWHFWPLKAPEKLPRPKFDVIVNHRFGVRP